MLVIQKSDFFALAQYRPLQGFFRDPFNASIRSFENRATSMLGTVLGAGDTKTGIPLRRGHTVIGETELNRGINYSLVW